MTTPRPLAVIRMGLKRIFQGNWAELEQNVGWYLPRERTETCLSHSLSNLRVVQECSYEEIQWGREEGKGRFCW